MWLTLTGAAEMMAARPGRYAELLRGPPTEHEPTISRDICRTFPKHQLFSDLGGTGQVRRGRLIPPRGTTAHGHPRLQRSLFNVLRAYATYDPDIGYCQGMGFIAGLFLAHVQEEVRTTRTTPLPSGAASHAHTPAPPCAQEAFWLLTALISRYGMRGLFSVDMPSFAHVMQTLEEQVAQHLPLLSDHLLDQGVRPSMFASQVRAGKGRRWGCHDML